MVYVPACSLSGFLLCKTSILLLLKTFTCLFVYSKPHQHNNTGRRKSKIRIQILGGVQEALAKPWIGAKVVNTFFSATLRVKNRQTIVTLTLGDLGSDQSWNIKLLKLFFGYNSSFKVLLLIILIWFLFFVSLFAFD